MSGADVFFAYSNLLLYSVRKMQLEPARAEEIVAAAERSGAKYLLTEDLQGNRRYGDVLVLNPFDHPPSEFLKDEETELTPDSC